MITISNQIQNINAGVEILKEIQMEILELKSIIPKVKNVLEVFKVILNLQKKESVDLKINW